MNRAPAHTSLYITQHKDDLGYQALITKFWTVTITCEWCREPFTHTLTAGNKPRYCPEHRTASRRAHFRDGVNHER